MPESPTCTQTHLRVAPAVYAALHVERRTARSFETTSPPDYFASWLLDQQYTPVPTCHTTEYGRFAKGTWQGKPAELVVLYWSGSIVCQGADAPRTARLIDTVCTGPSLEQADMFGEVQL